MCFGVSLVARPGLVLVLLRLAGLSPNVLPQLFLAQAASSLQCSRVTVWGDMPYPHFWFVRCNRCHKPYQTDCGSGLCGACCRFLRREYDHKDGRNAALELFYYERHLPPPALLLIRAYSNWPVQHDIKTDSESDTSGAD